MLSFSSKTGTLSLRPSRFSRLAFSFALIAAFASSVILPSRAQAQSVTFAGASLTLGNFFLPTGVAVDKHLNVFVSNYDGRGIYEIVAAGGYTTINRLAPDFTDALGGNFSIVEQIAVDADGNVFAADFSAVYEILAAGGYTQVKTLASPSGGFSEAVGVAVDKNDNVYVADQQNYAVYQILATGGYTTVNTLFHVGDVYASSVAVDGSANVFFVDSYNGTLTEILAAGGYSTTKTLLSGLSGPNEAAVDSSGNVYFQPPIRQ